MHETLPRGEACPVQSPPPSSRRERGLLLVVALTALATVLEIAVGYAASSMALLADGWHMATHVGALGIASAAYALARRFAAHRAFTFGTGKLHALAGYTSALGLAGAALYMITESLERLWHPLQIDFASSLPVAALGLLVNSVSVALLHAHEDHAVPAHEHDHNHRAAVMHVIADTLTSVLALLALLLGRFAGWIFLDAVSGVLGGLVIVKWGADLVRASARELLDVAPAPELEEEIRRVLEAIDDVRVCDLHVWPLGGGARSCVATLISAAPRDPHVYREHLRAFDLAHLTLEVRRCHEGHPAPIA
jgi:cation diffusion facilitator family transporter